MSVWMIILNNNNYNNKYMGNNNIYYIQTMMSLLCPLWSVNIAFIKTKRAYVFNLWYQYNYFCLKYFFVSAWLWSIIVIAQSQIPVILKKKFMKTFLVAGLIWLFLFFPKITMCAIIFIGSSRKYCHSTTIVLLSANPAFYQVNHYFKITVIVFIYLINFVRMFTLKVLRFGLSPSKKICVICFIKSPLKVIKKCFLFHLKSSFHSQDIWVFIKTFWSFRKNSLIRIIRLTSKFLTWQPG